MAQKHLVVDLNFNQNSAKQMALEQLATAPSSPVDGQVYFDTTKKKIGVYSVADGAWKYSGYIDGITSGTTALTVSIDANGVATLSISDATGATSGLMSAADKTKLDASTPLNTPSTIVERDASGNFAANIITADRVTGLSAPTAPSHAANKEYVDGVAQGLVIKTPARVVATTNQALTGTPTIDGVVTVSGNRILLTGQTNAIENGIWVAAAGAWSRPADFANGSDAGSVFVFVQEGTTYADTGWVCTANAGADVVGTNNLPFVQFSSAGTIIAGAGMSQTGNTFNVNAADESILVGTDDIKVQLKTDGAIVLGGDPVDPGIKVNTDGATVEIAGNALQTTNKIAKTVSKSVTLGVLAGPVAITHNLGTRNLSVTIIRESDWVQVDASVTFTSTNVITVEANGTDTLYTVAITGNVGTTLP